VRAPKTDGAAEARPKATARLASLRLLAQRRLTESALWTKLVHRGYEEEEIRDAIAMCKANGFVDDGLFARLFVDGRTKAVGNARLVAELVRRGIDREAAAHSVAHAEREESERLVQAIEKLFRTRSALSYPSAARALERLGFPTHAIYAHLRTRAQADFAPEAP
jgi:SOS response regulatory protein OraA/RecX